MCDEGVERENTVCCKSFYLVGLTLFVLGVSERVREELPEAMYDPSKKRRKSRVAK